MNSILYYLLQVIAASGLLYGYYHFFLRNNKFHQYNRYYLIAAVVISIFIPFLNIPVYFSQEQTDSSSVLQTLTFISYGSDIIISNKSKSTISITDVLYGAYILFILLALFKMAVSLIKIWKLSRNNPVEKIDNIFFVNTAEPGTPFSFFRWLFWDKKIDLDTDKGQQIFRHELFHIRQKHSFDTLFLELVTILFWINPFYHLIKKELKAIHEFLADQSAVKENEEWDYAELLLMQVLQTKHSLVNPFFHNQIKRRIAMITSSKKPSYQYLRKMMVLPMLALVTMLCAFTYKKINEPEKQLITEVPVQAVFTDTIPKKQLVKDIIIEKPIQKENTQIVGLRLTTVSDKKPLIILDGVVQVKDIEGKILQSVDPNTIESVTVLKDKAALEKYGPTAIDGVIEIVTKNTKSDALEEPVRDTVKPRTNLKLEEVVVTGYATKRDNVKKVQGLELKESVIPDKKPIIEEVVVTGYATQKDNIRKVEGLELKELKEMVVTGKKLTVQEVAPPVFQGGEDGWRKYLQRQLNAAVPVDNGAPAGVYKVVVQFLVDMDGSISDIKAKTNYGFGMEEEVIRILKIGPKWIPGTVDGKATKTYKQQPVTFVIEDEKDSKLDEVVVVGYPTKKNDAATNSQASKENNSLPTTEKSIDEAGSIYPNPATNLVQIPFSSKVAGAGLIQVLNASGNIVSTQRPAISKGLNTISVTTSSLRPGSYVIKLTSADGSGRSYKMIKK